MFHGMRVFDLAVEDHHVYTSTVTKKGSDGEKPHFQAQRSQQNAWKGKHLIIC